MWEPTNEGHMSGPGVMLHLSAPWRAGHTGGEFTSLCRWSHRSQAFKSAAKLCTYLVKAAICPFMYHFWGWGVESVSPGKHLHGPRTQRGLAPGGTHLVSSSNQESEADVNPLAFIPEPPKGRAVCGSTLKSSLNRTLILHNWAQPCRLAVLHSWDGPFITVFSPGKCWPPGPWQEHLDNMAVGGTTLAFLYAAEEPLSEDDRLALYPYTKRIYTGIHGVIFHIWMMALILCGLNQQTTSFKLPWFQDGIL